MCSYLGDNERDVSEIAYTGRTAIKIFTIRKKSSLLIRFMTSSYIKGTTALLQDIVPNFLLFPGDFHFYLLKSRKCDLLKWAIKLIWMSTPILIQCKLLKWINNPLITLPFIIVIGITAHLWSNSASLLFPIQSAAQYLTLRTICFWNWVVSLTTNLQTCRTKVIWFLWIPSSRSLGFTTTSPSLSRVVSSALIAVGIADWTFGPPLLSCLISCLWPLRLGRPYRSYTITGIVQRVVGPRRKLCQF